MIPHERPERVTRWRLIFCRAGLRAVVVASACALVAAWSSASLLPTEVATAANRGEARTAQPLAAAPAAEYVILFVLEGVGQDSLKGGPMPVLARLVKQGAVTWTATNPTPSLRLPSMASIVTGLPVEKHGITWDRFDFARGYPRPPSLFDYMDLSGGKDSAIFFMEESLYQLARPAPYTDYQMCGPLRPECNPQTVVNYVRDYLRKAASGEGYGHLVQGLPQLLLVHLPAPALAAQDTNWTAPAYGEALREVDKALGSILQIYEELGLLDQTAVFVTTLNPGGSTGTSGNGEAPAEVPWIVWGSGIKAGHSIEQPVSLLDTGATVMQMLGLETYTEWESHSVSEVFSDSDAKR